MRRRVLSVAPVLLLVTGACATKQDLLRSQQEISALIRAERVRSDSADAARLARLNASLDTLSDSLAAVSARMSRFQGDVRGDLYETRQQLLQIQELTGQSQRRLVELRASLEARAQEMAQEGVTPAGATPAAPGGAAGAPAGPAAGQPGPNQLFQLALDQLRRGSAGAARAGLAELLRQYPTADIAPDALFYVGETYSAEGNTAAADSVFALVVTRFPQSPRAPTALYKRAVALETAGRGTDARTLYDRIVKQYPRSDEAALAQERLRAAPR